MQGFHPSIYLLKSSAKIINSLKYNIKCIVAHISRLAQTINRMNILTDEILEVQSYTKTDLVNRLIRIADYLIGIIPNQFSNKDICELEGVLNEIYRLSYIEAWPLEIQEGLLEALGRASELSYLANRNKLNSCFFVILKQFPSILYMLAVHIEFINTSHNEAACQ